MSCINKPISIIVEESASNLSEKSNNSDEDMCTLKNEENKQDY